MFQDSVKLNNQYKYFTFISMLYCTLLTVSVLLPYKIINIFGFSEPGGIFIFPMTYLLGGAIAEAYGRKMALRMVWSSVFCLLFFNLLLYIIIRIPSAPTATHQEVFLQAFGSSMRLFAGCFVGLLCSDLTNVYRITRLKLIFKGRYFIQRCLWTTAISEGIFNVVTYTITYFGVISTHNLYMLMIYSWCLKMIYSLLMILPLLYLMNFLKKAENVDVYDVKDASGYNPELVLLKFLRVASLSNQEPQENATTKYNNKLVS